MATEHLKCDLLVLTNGTFSQEDFERLDLLAEKADLPELLSPTFLCWTSTSRDTKF